MTALDDRPVATETAVRTAGWPRWTLAGLLAATAVMYLWNLSASGYGNTFYAAAAQAGAQSWSAWFFGSLDAQNFITVDKPPASLWVTGLSVRLFGMNSWSVMAPQALMGVAAVAVLYAAVRRAFADPNHGAAAGLLAGAVLAGTPAAALMFRFNNPDALLVLLLTVAAYCLMRATPSASWQWLLLVGVAMGFAFLTKMMQGFLVLPGFGLAYLLCAPTSWPKRALHLLGAVGALIAAAGWWVLAVQLTPVSARPYIGGSTDNTVLDLALGYNGINRLLGHHRETNSLGGNWGGSTVPMFGAHSGLHRLFTGEMANEISWLIVVALFVIAFGIYLAARRALSRGELCALLMWGTWLVLTGVVFSFMGGMVHPYYTVALAPALAGLVGIGAVWAWRRRSSWDGRCALAAMIVLAAGPSALLLHRNAFGSVWLPWMVAGLAAVSAAAMLWPRPPVVALVAACVAGLASTAAVSVATAATPHHGTTPTAFRSSKVSGVWTNDEATNSDLAGLLAATHTRWSAATNGSQSAAELEIASGTSVMAVGGWSGDPVPTLQQFIDDIDADKISYYVAAGRGPTAATHGDVIRSTLHTVSHTREIADWVAANYPGTVIGGSTVYRLS
ncbi:glycosyltransferase family 39 protein [Mycolicibacterium moriokaense]